MRYQYLILLAVCPTIEAGPVQRFHGRSQFVKDSPLDDSRLHTYIQRSSDILPRFLNTTALASSTTTEVAPSTVSTEPIPLSSDSSLDAGLPSRIASSEDQPLEGKKQLQYIQNDISIIPEGASAGDAAASVSSSKLERGATSSTRAATEAAQLMSTTRSPTASSATSKTLATPNQEDAKKDAATIPRSPRPNNNGIAGGPRTQEDTPATSYLTSASSSASTEPTVNKNGGGALAAFERARSSRQPTDSSPSSTQATSAKAPGNTGFSEKVALATPSHSELGTTTSPATETSGFVAGAVDTRPSRSSQASNMQNTASSFALETSSTFRQIPTSPLRGDGSSSSSSGPRLPTSTKPVPQYAYPDASIGAAQMAQGYNEIFQSLDPSSPCDPNNSKSASACVRGQPGVCEKDGTYSLFSCNQGESCYAVPKGNGQSGITIGCMNPQAAHQAIASAASKKGGTPSGQGIPESQGASFSRVNSDWQSLTRPNTVPAKKSQASSSDENSQADATSASNVPAAAGRKSSPGVPKAQADHAPSDPTTNGASKQDTNPISKSFPEPTAFVDANEEASPARAPSNRGGQSESTQDEDLRNKQQDMGESSDSRKSSSGNEGDSSGHEGSRHKQQDSKDLSSSERKDEDRDSGVQLSFPGGKGPGKGSPEANQKNAVAADQRQSSEPPASPSRPIVSNISANSSPASTFLPFTASASKRTSPPDTTTGAAHSGDDMKGFITITVTQTTTVYGRR